MSSGPGVWEKALHLHPCLKEARLGPGCAFRHDAVSLGRTAWRKSDMGEALWKQQGERRLMPGVELGSGGGS